ncbi:Beta-glucuronidase [Penicillium rolfsii]|nr:Beta-glucuronidase [Penicillium rolfsii]
MRALYVAVGKCSNHAIGIPLPEKDSEPIPKDLQSFSLEFAFFPDYAGNKSSPNVFSQNLMENFKKITGVYPKIRVGGTSQDNSIYVPDQKDAIELIFTNPTDDQPSQINYSPAFFESYGAFGNMNYIHGLNMKQNSSLQQLTDAAVIACRSMGANLDSFELGNEINMEAPKYRPANYTLQSYVDEWNYKTTAIKATVEKACPGPFPGFMSPSFVILDIIKSTWNAEAVFQLGFDPKNLTKDLSYHNYMGVFSPPLAPVSYDLQRMAYPVQGWQAWKLTTSDVLMNHTNIQKSLAPHIQRAKNLAYLGHPYTLGETNSIANQGRNGESNVFGDALWLVDFSLWSATNNIERLHFHQGLNYRYASWQPIASKGQPPKTRAPYYGQIMVAAAIGSDPDTRIANIPLAEDTEAAYGIYHGEGLSKLVVINLRAYNQTATRNRPSREYEFKVPNKFKKAKLDLLSAPGSDSVESITFGGISFDYELLEGKPVAIYEKEETASIDHGILRISVADSSAVLVTLS